MTSYYLQKAGFDSTDPRLYVPFNSSACPLRVPLSDPQPFVWLDRTRLLSLTTQKFLSDIAKDSFHYARIRTNAQPQGRGRPTATGVKVRVSLLPTFSFF